eukprot:TRINITY_DN6974_c0_g1_i6.p1 TRINITY_DN6974_c0_g1~~TRINITY_DN6974_c0_g1_i6.p1  ORF type:complete len:251 (-),score=56.69 TRINITY_DN6974_c0_g1_i6:253-1005(-)
MFFLLSLLSLMSVSFAQRSSLGSCQFSRDCQAHARCRNIADASCVCNFGQCVISGNPFFRGSECNKFTDCACRTDPASCFCRGGFCQETRWECHEPADCNKLSKCRGKSCACTGNLCESDCASDADCKDFHCNRALGYMCKCENSLCAYKKKTTECKTISDCVSQGKCTAAAPCACTQDYCTLPWWVANRDQVANCRTDQDCESTILDCGGNKCACQNKKPINDYEKRGTCGPRRKFLKPNQNNDAVVFQ